jgi:hypothetical protein
MEPTKSLHAYALTCCKVGKEIWRQIDPINYPDYEVSNMGRIRRWVHPSNKQYSETPEAIHQRSKRLPFYGGYRNYSFGSKTEQGYMRVVLYSTKNLPGTMHRFIAKCFIPNCEDKPTVDHIDRNRSNNRLDNLTWATSKEQISNREWNPKRGSSKKIRKVWKLNKYTNKRLHLYESLKEAAISVGAKSTTGIADMCSMRPDKKGRLRRSVNGYKWEWDDMDELEGEEWKDIPSDIAIKDFNSGGAEARRTLDTPMKQVDKLKRTYKLSNYGRLYDVKNKKLVHGAEKVRGNTSFSFVMENEKTWIIYDHVLTALVWLPPNSEPIKKTQINHIDGNPGNCHVSNLEWSTRTDNMRHAFQSGLTKNAGWTEEEDAVIIEVVKKYGNKNVPWKNAGILKRLPNRSIGACTRRKRSIRRQLEEALS